MPDKSTSVLVEIYLNKVTCPGVILKDKSRIYISICLFGRAARSKSVSASFPLRYDENFTFQKVFFNCHDPVTLIEHFEDEDVMVELIQENDYISSGVVLATIDTSVRAFLFPASKKFLCYSSYDRAILMRRTLHFEGISPQIEFSTISTIKDIFTSAVDELEDKVKSICQETLSASKMAKNKSSPVSEQLSSTALNSGGESLSFENISNRNGIISSGSTKENRDSTVVLFSQKFHKKKKTKVSNQRSHKPPFVIRKVENKPYCRPFLNSATSLDSEHVSPLSNRQSVKLKKPTSFKSVKKSKTPSSKRSDTRDAKANKEISINEVEPHLDTTEKLKSELELDAGYDQDGYKIETVYSHDYDPVTNVTHSTVAKPEQNYPTYTKNQQKSDEKLFNRRSQKATSPRKKKDLILEDFELAGPINQSQNQEPPMIIPSKTQRHDPAYPSWKRIAEKYNLCPREEEFMPTISKPKRHLFDDNLNEIYQRLQTRLDSIGTIQDLYE